MSQEYLYRLDRLDRPLPEPPSNRASEIFYDSFEDYRAFENAHRMMAAEFQETVPGEMAAENEKRSTDGTLTGRNSSRGDSEKPGRPLAKADSKVIKAAKEEDDDPFRNLPPMRLRFYGGR
ncbi:P-loop containing nucleoside triphosphate hydrolase protein [Apiospora phragmitis]|uniref:P-loop containing nucleoside triphosphate hydrolase protein n=1 Tax=Apiospora phragmitis TaxID=2905665 RepID=A0ABR1TP49_9PEZI